MIDNQHTLVLGSTNRLSEGATFFAGEEKMRLLGYRQLSLL